jgi:hypothetical protein
MRQLREYGTYFRPFSGARATIRMLFTGCTLLFVGFSSIADARGTVNKVCLGKTAGRHMQPLPFLRAMGSSETRGSWLSQACLALACGPPQ